MTEDAQDTNRTISGRFNVDNYQTNGFGVQNTTANRASGSKTGTNGRNSSPLQRQLGRQTAKKSPYDSRSGKIRRNRSDQRARARVDNGERAGYTTAPMAALPTSTKVKKVRNIKFHKAVIHLLVAMVWPIMTILSVLSLVTFGIYYSLDQTVVGQGIMYAVGWWKGGPKTADEIWQIFLNVWFFQIILAFIIHLVIYTYFKLVVRVSPLFGRGDPLQSMYAFLSMIFSICPGAGMIPFYVSWVHSVK